MEDAAREKQVWQQVKNQEACISQLEAKIVALENGLEKVLRSGSGGLKEGKNEASEALVPLAEHLQAHSDRISLAVDQISEMLMLLEV